MEHQSYPETAAQFPGNNRHFCSMPEAWDGEQPGISTAKLTLHLPAREISSFLWNKAHRDRWKMWEILIHVIYGEAGWDFRGIGVIPAASEQGEGLAELSAPIWSHLNIISTWKYRPIWSLEGGFKGIPGEQGVKAESKVFRSIPDFHLLCPSQKQTLGKGPGGVFPAGSFPAAPNSSQKSEAGIPFPRKRPLGSLQGPAKRCLDAFKLRNNR